MLSALYESYFVSWFCIKEFVGTKSDKLLRSLTRMTALANREAPYDVAIVGGGMVGASLALALGPLRLRVAMIEAVSLGLSAHPSFDERTTALSNGSRRVLEGIGAWPYIEREATPIRRLHVSD